MKAPKISPLEGKKLRVIIVEKEYSEPFWVAEPPRDELKNLMPSAFKPSIAFCTFIKKLVDEVKPDFATEELGNRTLKEFTEKNPLYQAFKEKNIQLFPVDIEEREKESLVSLVSEKMRLRDEIVKFLKEISARKEERSLEEEFLSTYLQHLQQEINETEREIKFSIREKWIATKILENARKIDKGEIVCVHISSPEHISGIKKSLEAVGVEVDVIRLEKKVVFTEKVPSGDLKELLRSMQVQVKPIVRRPAEEPPYILFFLDTEEKASPFDICMAYDAGFDVVVPYENVSTKDVKRIVQDAIFSRDPRGIKRTCFFVGGKDLDKAEEIFKIVQESMFPPFKTSIIVDPAGAYTTAAAMVAMVEEGCARLNLGELKDKRCAIFGTGPVGRTAAIILSRLGCVVTIVSPNPQRVDGEAYVASLSNLLRTKHNVEVKGVFAPTREKKLEVINAADVILCAAGAGIQVIDKEILSAIRSPKVIADVNAVPPLGVEGIKLDDDMREIVPGVFTIGALTIGRLKYKVEQEILREARDSEKPAIFDYNYAFQLARKILRGDSLSTKLAVTLKYPPHL